MDILNQCNTDALIKMRKTYIKEVKKASNINYIVFQNCINSINAILLNRTITK